VRWVEVKTKADSVYPVLKATDQLRQARHRVWLLIQKKIDMTTLSILDKYGVTGWPRLSYCSYARSLWKWFSRYPENVWPHYIQSEFNYYRHTHGLDETILKEVTDATVEVIREILEKGVEVPRGVEGAEGGGAGEAVGEGGGGGEAGGGEGGGPVHEGAGQRGGGDEVPEVRGGVQGVRGGGVGA
jgi:hypothetical protein